MFTALFAAEQKSCRLQTGHQRLSLVPHIDIICQYDHVQKGKWYILIILIRTNNLIGEERYEENDV